MRSRIKLIALLAALVLVFAACGGDDDDGGAAEDTTTAPPVEDTTTTTEEPMEDTTTTAMPEETTTLPPPTEGAEVLACQVSDTGGIDDKSFNETAWKGAQDAEAELEGVTIEFLESQEATDFRPNIDSFINQGCDLITTVGFLLANDTGAAAADNPDQKFAIIDFPVGDFPPWCTGDVQPGEDGEAETADDTCGAEFTTNVRGITFQTDEAAFLAGYLAAARSESGVVGTFGGINIPTVTIFMEGFRLGVDYYNTQNGTSVTVLGWDGTDGLFTGNFESLEDGRAFAQNLVDEGADILLPVAGPVGLGSAAFCQETGSCLMIGVDADQFFSAPEFADVWLTSVQKNMDVAVFNTINNVLVLDSIGNPYVGTLANNGVGLAPAHDVAWPDGVADELATIQGEIVAAGGLAAFLAPPEEEG